MWWNSVLRVLGYVFILCVVAVLGFWSWSWLHPNKPLQFTQGAPVEQGQLKKEVDADGNKVLRDQDGNVVMTVHKDSSLPVAQTVPKDPSVKITETKVAEGVSDIQFSAKINEGRNLSVSIATDDATKKCVKKGDETAEVKAEAASESWSGKTLRRKTSTKSSSIRTAQVEKPEPAVVAQKAPVPTVAVAPVAVQQKSVAPPCKGDCEGERFVLPAPRDQYR